ncbi:MAG: hypothetical protein K0B11_16855 [Mariniphaga sp.]|nr:hypothetical protein [Mariniphaga sp.]
MEGKNFVKRDGTIEIVLPEFNGNDTVKVYINPIIGKTTAGYQNGGEKHSGYSKSNRITDL